MNTMSEFIQDPAFVLAAVYNGSRPQGLGVLHATSEVMTVEQAKEILANVPTTYFDYLQGRVLKIDVANPDPRLYERDLGQGAFERALQQQLEIEKVKDKKEKN